MNRHALAAIWGGLGGVLMGTMAGVLLFTPLAGAGIVAGTIGGFLAVAALPMLAMGYREGREYYLDSVQHARLPVDPQIMGKPSHPPPGLPPGPPEVTPEVSFVRQERARRLAAEAGRQEAAGVSR